MNKTILPAILVSALVLAACSQESTPTPVPTPVEVSNPYEILKESGLKVLEKNSFTSELAITIDIDPEEMDSDASQEMNQAVAVIALMGLNSMTGNLAASLTDPALSLSIINDNDDPLVEFLFVDGATYSRMPILGAFTGSGADSTKWEKNDLEQDLSDWEAELAEAKEKIKVELEKFDPEAEEEMLEGLVLSKGADQPCITDTAASCYTLTGTIDAADLNDTIGETEGAPDLDDNPLTEGNGTIEMIVNKTTLLPERLELEAASNGVAFVFSMTLDFEATVNVTAPPASEVQEGLQKPPLESMAP